MTPVTIPRPVVGGPSELLAAVATMLDPFTKGGLFQKITVERWRKAYFDHKRFI